MESLSRLQRVSDCKWSKEHIEEADALVKWLSGQEAGHINYAELHGEVDEIDKTIPLIRRIAHFILDAAAELKCPPSINAILGIVDAELRKQGDIDIRIVALAAIFRASAEETLEPIEQHEQFSSLKILINPENESIEADPEVLQFFADTLGLPYRMLDSLTLPQIFHPRSHRIVKQGIMRICRGGLSNLSFECILCGHNQQKKIPVTVVLAQQLDGTISASISDNTKQTVLKEKLRHSQKIARLKSGQYEKLFKETPVALMEVDFSAAKMLIRALIQFGVEDLKKHLKANHKELFNLVRKLNLVRKNAKTDELVGLSGNKPADDFEKYCTPETIDALIEFFVALSEGNSLEEVETKIRNSDGEERNIIVRMINVPDSDATSSRTLVSVMDITQVTQREEKRRGNVVGMLAEGVAHELNNAIMEINGAADLIAKGASVEENIQRIQGACGKSADIITELLTISLKREADPHVYNLAEKVLGEIAASIRGLIDRPNVTIESACSGDIGNIRVDIQQLKDIILRLCLNSVDAMPNGGSIRLNALNSDRNVVIEVTDNGEGINEEIQSEIFDPFFTTKAVGKGRGLGLSVAKGLAEQNNGRIEVDSMRGFGTTVRMIFPRIEGVRKSQRIDMRRLIPESLRGRGDIGVFAASSNFGTLCETMLQRCGYSVVRFTNPEEIEGMNGNSPDLILVDASLSDSNGWERNLIKRHPGIKIIYMGSESADEGVLRTVQLRKPFNVVKLATLVKQTLAAS